MRVKKIIIHDVLGIECLEIVPGALTVIEGRNASGKTSIIEAIRSVVSGGHEPDLIRQGAEEGRVSIQLDDGVEIRKRITPERSTLTVTHPKMGKVSKSKAWIDQIVDSLSLDPVAFLSAPAKDRIGILLNAMPIAVTAKQLDFMPISMLKGKDLSQHAMTVLADLRKNLYDERTGLNRAAKEKEATVSQMVSSLPASSDLIPDAQDWNAMEQILRQEMKILEDDNRKRIDKIEFLNTRLRTEGRIALEVKIEAIKAEAEARIEDLKKDMLAASTDICSERDAALIAARKEFEPSRDELADKIASVKARAEEKRRLQSVREFIHRLEAEAKTLGEKSEACTEMMAKLDALKTELLTGLPIEGLEIRDGQIYVNDIPFDRLNESAKIQLAIEVAKMRASDLGLILLDRLESFDSSTWSLFEEAAKASGIQWIAARVTDDNLSVKEICAPSEAGHDCA